MKGSRFSKKDVENIKKKAIKYIKKYPLASVAIAVGIGAILSHKLNRKL